MIACLFLSLVIASGTQAGGSMSVADTGTQSHLGAAAYLLKKEKIDEYRPLALSGDVEKAMSIYYHYSMFEDNQIDAEFWLRVAAERNYCYALKEYVRLAQATPRLNTETRITYWKDREAEACGR